jgi:hypothetical protein
MICPNCNSDDTKTAKMAYLTSTTKTVSQGTNRTLSFAASGGPTIGGGSSYTESLARLSLVDEVLPPPAPMSFDKKMLGVFSITLVAALFIFGAARLESFYSFLFLFALIGMALSVLTVRVDGREWDAYHVAYRIYESKWICMRCGHAW